MSNKIDVLSFDELARFHGLSLMKWDEDNYASENTQLANDFFEEGKKSKQDEIDRIIGIVTEAYKSGGNSSVETIYDKVQELLK